MKSSGYSTRGSRVRISRAVFITHDPKSIPVESRMVEVPRNLSSKPIPSLLAVTPLQAKNSSDSHLPRNLVE